jgi:sec-independent protein translocase protein TatA
MPNVGPVEILILLVLAMLVLGPRRLPRVGRAVGRAIHEFRAGLGGSADGAPLSGALPDASSQDRDR